MTKLESTHSFHAGQQGMYKKSRQKLIVESAVSHGTFNCLLFVAVTALRVWWKNVWSRQGMDWFIFIR